MEKKGYNWIKGRRWLMPLGFAMLAVMCVAAILLCVRKDFSEMATDNVFDIGVDILSILICLAIYYGCMNGRDREGEATYLLTAMLRVIGGAQFLDVCVHLMDGIPSLWFLYRVVMAGYYAANPMVNLLFWHYVRVALKMSGERTEKITRLMEAVFAVEMVACWINLAVPFYFTVNRQGQYSRSIFNPLNAGFVIITTIILIYAFVRSNALNRKNRIVLAFIALPLISTLTDAMYIYLISEYSAWGFLPKGKAPALAFAEPEELEEMPEQYQFRNETIRLKPGEAIFQYTDGVTEATYDVNAGEGAIEAMFGEKRLLDAVNELGGAAPEKLLPHIRARIDAFVNGGEQFDDITMLGLQYRGAE